MPLTLMILPVVDPLRQSCCQFPHATFGTVESGSARYENPIYCARGNGRAGHEFSWLLLGPVCLDVGLCCRLWRRILSQYYTKLLHGMRCMAYRSEIEQNYTI